MKRRAKSNFQNCPFSFNKDGKKGRRGEKMMPIKGSWCPLRPRFKGRVVVILVGYNTVVRCPKLCDWRWKLHLKAVSLNLLKDEASQTFAITSFFQSAKLFLSLDASSSSFFVACLDLRNQLSKTEMLAQASDKVHFLQWRKVKTVAKKS